MIVSLLPHLESLNSQQNEMTELVTAWAHINSGSDNLQGLQAMFSSLQQAFASLGGTMSRVSLPPRKKLDNKGHITEIQSGEALHIRKRPEAKMQVLLAGHMDTVYETHSSFQKTELIKPNILRGPGVADMKGGLVILLKALQAFEKSPFAKRLGWEVIINPDEEVGSPSSELLYLEAAKRNRLGLIFEPSFQDGSIVSARKGSANFAIISRGRSAHSGRDFHEGKNAITALSRFITEVDSFNSKESAITINVGNIQGGGPINIVPDFAICRLNIRVETMDQMQEIKQKLQTMVEKRASDDGVKLELHSLSHRTPKPFNPETQNLFHSIKMCGEALSTDIKWKPSGGVSDGNIVAMAGLPCADTLGAIGGNIHTSEEFIYLDSLPARAKLTTLILMALASGEIKEPKL